MPDASIAYDAVGDDAHRREDQAQKIICTATRPSVGSTNCGRSARKNSAVFGFRTFTTTPRT